MSSFLSKEQVQHYLLETLIEFKNVCDRLDLRYSLSHGTLLGAVRHQGFIPWDDDVDVIMPREDYERLLHEYVNNTDFFVLSGRNSPFPFPFAKFCNSKVRVKTDEYHLLSKEYLWLDIFPLDGVPEEEKKMASWIKRRELYMKIAYIYTKWSPSATRRILKRIFGVVLSPFFDTRKCVALIERGATGISLDEATRVGLMAWSPYGVKDSYPKEYFSEYTQLLFEGVPFSVLANWDAYLTHLYGDYKVLPPEAERHTHLTLAWI